MTNKHFTDDHLRSANNVDLTKLLPQLGEHIKRVGDQHILIYYDQSGRHDSISLKGSLWYDHKNVKGGKAIDFMRYFYGLDFQTAVQRLLDYDCPSIAEKPIAAQFASQADETESFALPERNPTMCRLYGYLINERKIDIDVIRHFVGNKTLYEERSRHSIVFVGLDKNGVPKQAHMRSTVTQFKQTCKGSDTRYSFSHFGENEKLYVFEAPIDMMSFITLYPENWQRNSYIALNGLYDKAMLTALCDHNNIKEIILCVDNDKAGDQAVDRLTKILHKRGYQNISRLTPACKDWNDVLKEKAQQYSQRIRTA